MGLKVVAEGVENPEEQALLTHYQCDYLQGFWVGKPMTASAIEKRYAPKPREISSSPNT
ncbi:MAG: EAL domain-containing protein [Phormidesmis sp.]